MNSKIQYLKGAGAKGTITLLLALIATATVHAQMGAGPYTDSAVLGWDGDLNGVIAHLDGSYYIRLGNDGSMPYNVTFGIANNPPSPLQWFNEGGYLPSYTTDFFRNGCHVQITNFGDKIAILDNQNVANQYVAIYTRIVLTNVSPGSIDVCPSPTVSPNPSPNAGLIQLTSNRPCTTLSQRGQSVTYDYVIAVDRFNGAYGWPSATPLAAAGSWNTHHSDMVNYWTSKLNGIVNIQHLPEPDLINAYKAGYIYTHIIKDPAVGSTPVPGGTPPHHELKVGEANYEEHQFDMDRLGILATLLTLGDPEAETLLDEFPTYPGQVNWPQPAAKWLYPWLWAIYLEKYQNDALAVSHFSADIMRLARQIGDDRCLTIGHGDCGDLGYEPNGLIHKTDFENHDHDFWAIDDWSALLGLASYSYVCDRLSRYCTNQCLYTSEKAWADAQYNDLLAAVNARHQVTIALNGLDYLPISMTRPNDQIVPPLLYWDANWGVFLQFGRWAWDGYLLGANQNGVELDLIDSTYTSRINFGRSGGLEPHNFGAYAAISYSSTYNAGYGTSSFRGEIYRSEGIEAYKFMLAKGQSGPYSWWESFTHPDTCNPNPWVGIHPCGASSISMSCPHMQGQSTATKVLLDSLIAQKADGSVIIGRGVPTYWIAYDNTEFVHVSNFPIESNGRAEFILTGLAPNKVKLDLLPHLPNGNTILDLRAFRYNIRSVTQGTFSQVDGTITLPQGQTTTTVTLVTTNVPPIVTLRQAENANLTGCYKQVDVNALGGYRVDGIDQPGDNVEFTDCPAGTHLVFGYATPWPGNMSVYVNGNINHVFFPNTGAWDIIGQTDVAIDIPDHATVKVQFDPGSFGINLDYMQIY